MVFNHSMEGASLQTNDSTYTAVSFLTAGGGTVTVWICLTGREVGRVMRKRGPSILLEECTDGLLLSALMGMRGGGEGTTGLHTLYEGLEPKCCSSVSKE